MSKKTSINEADKIFSLYIRNRGANFGYNHCFTCGVYLPVEDLQCGHFRSRRFIATRWHQLNCWPQCNRCNVELGGNLDLYEKKLRSSFGDEAIDALYDLSRSHIKMTDADVRDIIKQYKK